MGQFSVSIEVANPAAGDFASVDALVDTGSYSTMLPASLLESLGMSPSTEMTFKLADGSSKVWGVAPALFRVEGIEAYSNVAFGAEGTYLLGAVTLEELALTADTTHKKLVSPPELLAVGVQAPGFDS
jgi:clan AA aspartic protease